MFSSSWFVELLKWLYIDTPTQLSAHETEHNQSFCFFCRYCGSRAQYDNTQINTDHR